MANRKRGTFSLPQELQTTERLSTKKEPLSLHKEKVYLHVPPVPNKLLRKSIFNTSDIHNKPKTVSFDLSVGLSPIYNPTLSTSYMDQVFSRQGLVGEGSFGRVYRVRSREDNKLYAIKRLKSFICLKDRYAEVRNNEKIGTHPNCVKFFMAWEEDSEVYMMLEFCSMSLADYSILNNDIPEDLLWDVLYDICKALHFLHKRSLLHLDVKPGNIMMKDGLYKLGDFGILVDLKLAPLICKSTLSDGDSKYLALEVLEGIYQPSCDIFGLGISLLELAADLELPSHGPLWQQLRHEILPQVFYDRVSLGFKVIIERMLNPQHDLRPSAEKLLKYKSLKVVDKRDKKYPRTDYAAEYINEIHSNENLPLHSLPIMINNNNIIAPVENQPQDNRMKVGSYKEEANVLNGGRKSLFNLIDNRNSPPGRKQYITLAEMNEFFEVTHHTKSESSLSDTENSLLATDLSESNLTGEIFPMDVDSQERNGISNNEDIAAGGKIITSTPVLKNKQIRRLPKTKLTFD
ncbi:hypothetical protein NQ317_010012 [Molorchus minor]|uniref:non-specific serine/threonine protein kinase n=1 Tax=Molorchus minor TaxID=1323400 RepID=A0ABQ9K9U9_9CUCU|nr:hypothetical protein NQ317_010012 [Molorchus minor]